MIFQDSLRFRVTTPSRGPVVVGAEGLELDARGEGAGDLGAEIRDARPQLHRSTPTEISAKEYNCLLVYILSPSICFGCTSKPSRFPKTKELG